MRLFANLAAIVAVLASAGCAMPINVSEVMQHPEGTQYYTAHNIWYQGARRISSINYQSGAIIPFGTPVDIVKATKWTVDFKDLTTGKEHVIIYHENWGLEPMEGYLKKLLTTKSGEELTKGMSPRAVAAMRRGEVCKGMTKKQVAITFGPPSPHRTPSWDNETWIYWVSRWNTKRVVFKNDKVLEVIE